MNNFIIEKNVPIPPKRMKSSTSPLIDALKKMQINDSIFIATTKETHERQMSRFTALYIKLKPLTFTTRTVDGGFRAWRVE